jgi:hypothetical protein
MFRKSVNSVVRNLQKMVTQLEAVQKQQADEIARQQLALDKARFLREVAEKEVDRASRVRSKIADLIEVA